jgi:cobalt/nickel transport system permease protein
VASIEAGLADLGRLDRLSRQDTAVHRLDPRTKVAVTFAYLLCVVSFGKYEVTALLPFALFPVALAATGNLPFGYLARKVAAFAPFAVMVGLFNPLLDRAVVLHAGPVEISGGWVSFASILVRFALTLGAALVLVGTTSFHGVCAALERLGTPRAFATQLLFLHRYLFVLGDEAARTSRARALRSVGGRGMGMKVYGQIVGHLLLRTLDRAQRIHLAMRCRGFDGRIRSSAPLSAGWADARFALGWCAAFALFRLVHVPRLVGSLVEGAVR